MSKFQPKEGDVVIVKTENKNRGTWPLAVMTKTHQGRDGVFRGVELKTATGVIDRPVQLLYPLELKCDVKTTAEQPRLNLEAPEYRPKRDAAVAAEFRLKEVERVENV